MTRKHAVASMLSLLASVLAAVMLNAVITAWITVKVWVDSWLAVRRKFRYAATEGTSCAMGVATPLAINLAAMSEAAAFDSTDYKALVCIFLYGGNDYANTVVPYDAANYALYHQIRGGGAGEDQAGIAIARADLAATALTPLAPQTLTDNLQYALNPQLGGLKTLWDAGKLAVQLNVGPLVKPTTLAQYLSTNRVANPLPPKLFSHNDQQSVWQSNGTEGSTVG